MKFNPPRHDIDASGGMHPIGGRLLRMARAATSRHEPTSGELRLARHMAQDGKNLHEIHAALGWKCTEHTTHNRLRKFNIFVRVDGRSRGLKARYGGNTGTGSGSGVDVRSWKPRALE